MNILFKLACYIKMPVVVAFSCSEDSKFEKFLSLIIKDNFSISKSKTFFSPFKNDILLFQGSVAPFNYSKKPVLVLNDLENMVNNFPSNGFVLTDFSKSKNIEGDFTVNSVGFTDSSSLWISDLIINSETNFKVNYGGDSVPFWIKDSLSQEELIDLLLAIRVSMILGLNLIQISQSLDNT